jgi:predicted ATPase with chaperone activity
MFLYGSPGNGKTAIAEALVRMLGGDIYIPHAIEVQGEIVRVYDPVHHPLVNPGQPESVDDPRWVHVRRPVVTVGGELTLPTLDLIYNEASRYYEAPFQMKANNGAFFIDDFGRQQVSPRDLLNRWIVPLENRVDFLSLRTGQKMEVPFDTLVIFSTNLDPTDLVDEAFLRRIRYKVEIKSPGEVQFKEIFRRVCAAKGVGCDEDVLDYLCTVKYPELGVEPRAVHPRDLVEQVVDYCRYKELPLQLTNGLLDIACSNYFVHLEM